MLWTIVLTTLLFSDNNGKMSNSVSVINVGKYYTRESCLENAKFLAKGIEKQPFQYTTYTKTTAVCIPIDK